MGTDSTANFDPETVEKPSSTLRSAQTVPISTVTHIIPVSYTHLTLPTTPYV